MTGDDVVAAVFAAAFIFFIVSASVTLAALLVG